MSCEAHNIDMRNACVEAGAHGDDVYVNANGILMCQYCHLVVYWTDTHSDWRRDNE